MQPSRTRYMRACQLEVMPMPEISRFFGIVIYMYFEDHNPPHIHVRYQGKKAMFDFNGNILGGDLGSRTATKLVREWIDFHVTDLQKDWELARNGRSIERIKPLE